MRIAVIGDSGLDVWITGKPHKLAQEGGSAVVHTNTKKYATPAMAAHVAWVLALNGHSPTLFTYIGNDAAGAKLLRLLVEAGVSCCYAPCESTTTKIRCLGGGDALLGRWDDDCVVDGTRPLLVNDYSDFDAVIISDYNKGVFETEAGGIELPTTFSVPVIAAIKPRTKSIDSNIPVWYSVANESEWHEQTGLVYNDLPPIWSDPALTFGNSVMVRKGLVVTGGHKGARLHNWDSTTREFNTVSCVPQIPDENSIYTCGAGDVFTAAFAVEIACGNGRKSALQTAVDRASNYVLTGERIWS